MPKSSWERTLDDAFTPQWKQRGKTVAKFGFIGIALDAILKGRGPTGAAASGGSIETGKSVRRR